MYIYNCAACFFKREIQVALFTFTLLHCHFISSPSPIHHLFTITTLPSLYHHHFTISFTFTTLPSLYHHHFTISSPSPIHYLFTFIPLYHLFNHLISSTTCSRSHSCSRSSMHATIVLDGLVYVLNICIAPRDWVQTINLSCCYRWGLNMFCAYMPSANSEMDWEEGATA